MKSQIITIILFFSFLLLFIFNDFFYESSILTITHTYIQRFALIRTLVVNSGNFCIGLGFQSNLPEFFY